MELNEVWKHPPSRCPAPDFDGDVGPADGYRTGSWKIDTRSFCDDVTKVGPVP